MLEQQLVNGITLGSTYALIAIGYSLVLGVLNKLNIAHERATPQLASLGL